MPEERTWYQVEKPVEIKIPFNDINIPQDTPVTVQFVANAEDPKVQEARLEWNSGEGPEKIRVPMDVFNKLSGFGIEKSEGGKISGKLVPKRERR